MSITLMTGTTDLVARLLGMAWAAPVAVLLAGAIGVALDIFVFGGSSDHAVFLLAVPVAMGLGALLGPRVVRGDRWTAGAVAFAAAVLGTLVGAAVFAAYFTTGQGHHVGDLILGATFGGLILMVFAGVPALLVAIPATLAWAALVRASAGRWDRYVGSARSLPHR